MSESMRHQAAAGKINLSQDPYLFMHPDRHA